MRGETADVTTYTGTDGFDYIVGTEGSDSFRPLLSVGDEVYGRGGYDTLFVDYGSIAGPHYVSGRLGFEGGTLGGTFESFSIPNRLQFAEVERIVAKFGAGDDALTYSATELPSGTELTVNAGAGRDELLVNMPTVPGVQLVVGSTGVAATNFGARFVGFERFIVNAGAGASTISTGAGADRVTVGLGESRIATGAGDDVIRTVGGADRIDAGDGEDTWRLDLTASAGGASLAKNGLTFGDVFAAHVFLVGDPAKGDQIDFAGLNSEWAKRFGTPEQPNRPSRAAFQAKLPTPGALVEIELVAAKKAN